jgi:molecular chaperone DnaK
MAITDQFAVGIDFGTSTSEICVFRNGERLMIPDPGSISRTPIVPSLVAMNSRGEAMVGEAARSLVDRPGYGWREVKRLMGTGKTVTLQDREYRPEELAALIIRKLLDHAEEALGRSIRQVVLSVPANATDAAREATRTAGRLAGVEVLRLINEPTAAALAFGIEYIDVEEKLAVFDFGGGTLDVTILEMVNGVLDVCSSYGDTELGGKEFDEVLCELLKERFAAQYPGASISDRSLGELKRAAEMAKIQLSTQQAAMVYIPMFGAEDGLPVDLDLEVTRTDFEQRAAPLVEKAKDCLEEALRRSKLAPSDIDRILLVGGSTYIPMVRRMVAESFGREPRRDVDPDMAVAMGASVQAALATDLIAGENSVILVDVAPFGLGTDVLTLVDGQRMLVYDPLIQPNTTIPYSTRRMYSLITNDQKQVAVRLYQDHIGNTRRLEDVVDTGIEGMITGIPPSTTGEPHDIEVEFSYNIDGIVRVHAVIQATGQSVNIGYEPSTLRMSEGEIADAREVVRELWQSQAQSQG